MADNVQGFDHLTSVLMDLGQQNRQDAIKELMIQSKMKQPGIAKDPNAMAEIAREKLNMATGDRAEAVYSAMYDNILKQSPNMPAKQIDALVRSRMTPESMAGITKYYGSKTPYNLPKNTTAKFMEPDAQTTTDTSATEDY